MFGLHSMCVGADAHLFNGHTDITSDRFLVFGVGGVLSAAKSLRNALLFNALAYMSDKLLVEGRTVAALDELYLWLSNPIAIEYIRNCLKRVRKRDSALMMASQNLEDFNAARCNHTALTNFIAAHKPTHIFSSPCTALIMSTMNEPHGSKNKEEAVMLNENVVKLLKSGMWDLATCANGEPNVVPVAFKDVTPDGKLVVGDVFLDTTLKNLAASNGKIAISVYDAQNLEGYQVKGTAQYITEGEVVSTFKAMVEKMFSGAATAKGALVITPEKVIVTTPGADNKKEL